MRTVSLPGLFCALAALCTLAPGCPGDKTEAEYRQGQVEQQLSKIQPIEGVYRGNLIEANSQGGMGALVLELRAESRVQKSSDNLTSEQEAIVRGTISYTGITNANVTFDQGFYDDKTGIFNASFTINDDAGKPVAMNLKGTIANGTFSGALEADGQPTYGGKFSLIKDGPAASAQGLSSSRLQGLKAERRIFVGNYDDNGTAQPLAMTIIYRQTTPEQVFLNVFLPIRDVQVSFDFREKREQKGNAGPRDRSAFQILFDDAHIDDQTHSLRGETSLINGAKKSAANLDCTSTIANGQVESWSCQILIDGRQMQAVVLKPAANQQQ